MILIKFDRKWYFDTLKKYCDLLWQRADTLMVTCNICSQVSQRDKGVFHDGMQLHVVPNCRLLFDCLLGVSPGFPSSNMFCFHYLNVHLSRHIR